MTIKNYRLFVNKIYLTYILQDNSVKYSVKPRPSLKRENVMMIVLKMTVITINVWILLKHLLMVKYVLILMY